MRRILAGDVRDVLCFQPGERPVFCLTFSNGEKLVVKAEIKTSSGHATQSIPLAGAMMKQVSPSMQIEMLDDREFRELKRLAESPERFRQPNSAEAARAYLELYTSPEAQPMNAYYKMPFVDRLTDITKGSPALTLLRLKKPPALFSFGKIVAVDLFIGNNDRFNAMGELVNPDNLLFQQVGGSITPMGLDFFQAQGEAANLLVGPPENQVVSRQKRIFKYLWGGENLLNENNLRFFAEKAIDSLNDYFSQQNMRQIRTLLGPDDVNQFVHGMREGTKDLKQFLVTRGGLPEGVRIRMDRFNWPYNTAIPPRPVKPAPFRKFVTANPIVNRRPGPTIGSRG